MKQTLVLLIILFISNGLLALESDENHTNQALMKLLEELQENGTITKSVYEAILQVAKPKVSVEKTKENIIANQIEIKKLVKKEVDKATKDQVKIQVKDKLQITSNDGAFKMRIGGRLQTDSAFYDEDRLTHKNGTSLRRARIFIQGTLHHFWNYKLQYDFVRTGRDGIADAYIQYIGLPWAITIGHFKQPFSLQGTTSSKYITFMERALPHAFSPGRAIGISAKKSGYNWALNIGLFGEEGLNRANNNEDGGYAFVGRGTYAPILSDSEHLHLGFSASYRSIENANTISFNQRPESHITNRREINTGLINAKTNLSLVAEGAYTYKRASIQGEYYFTNIERDDDSNLDFSGYYVETSLFLTENMRNYSPKKGAYGKIKTSPVGSGSIGAWQIVARFSSVDLIDSDIVGGEAKNFSLGLNWYATNNIRISANYINVLDVKDGVSDGDNPKIFQLRAQAEF